MAEVIGAISSNGNSQGLAPAAASCSIKGPAWWDGRVTITRKFDSSLGIQAFQDIICPAGQQVFGQYPPQIFGILRLAGDFAVNDF